MCMAANRFKNIRATLVHNIKQAKWAKINDDANILCLSAWQTNVNLAKKIVNTWLKTPFKKLARRVRRFKKIVKW